MGVLLCIILLILLVSLIAVLNMFGVTVDGFSAVASISTAFSTIGTLILLYFTYRNLKLTRQSLNEMKKQRELDEKPVVNIKVEPKHKNSFLLYFVIQNTGGGSAYDVSVKFNPNISYNNSTLNDLKIFQRIPLIDKGESIEFFFDSAPEYLESDNPKETRATITYYKYPKEEKESMPITREIDILFEQRSGSLQIIEHNFDDLVKEVEEIKQGLLMILMEKEDKND